MLNTVFVFYMIQSHQHINTKLDKEKKNVIYLWLDQPKLGCLRTRLRDQATRSSSTFSPKKHLKYISSP